MKKYKDITGLNYYDICLFTGKTVWEAKIIISLHFGVKEFTKSQDPKVTVKMKIPIEMCAWKYRSNSGLDGVNVVEHLVGVYNQGVDLNCLRAFGENKTNIQKGRFTKKHRLLNDILNREQYEKLQGIWARAKAVEK